MGLEPDESLLQEALQRLTQTVMELAAAEQVGGRRPRAHAGTEDAPEWRPEPELEHARGRDPAEDPWRVQCRDGVDAQAFSGWASILLRGNLPRHPAHRRRPSRCRGGGLRIQFDAARTGTGLSLSRAPGGEGVLDLKTCPLLR